MKLTKAKKLLTKQTSFGNFEIFDQRPSFPVYSLQQIHSAHVVEIFEDSSPASFSHKADAMVFLTHSPTAKAIVTADCLPIYLQGRTHSALIHAGWKGLNLSIMKHPLIQKLQAEYAYIGPHILDCCFKVTPDFKENFIDSKNFSTRVGLLYFNLYNEAVLQIKKLSPQIQIEGSGVCTCCHKDFHSYRSNKTMERNWNIFIPKEKI